MVASFKGYYEIVRILLEKKADVNKTNAQGIEYLIQVKRQFYSVFQDQKNIGTNMRIKRFA